MAILLWLFAMSAFPVVFFVILYHIIKSAVRNAIWEAHEEIAQERRDVQREYRS